MPDSRFTTLRKTLLTPRKLAWILVIAGTAKFVSDSPKTPVEFFDTAVRDEAAIRGCEIEKYKMIDPAGAAASRELEDMWSCRRRMDRITLLYDLANNPKQVNRSKSSIIEGQYSSDESTDAILRTSDEHYRSLAQEFERRKREIWNDTRRQAAREKVSDGVVKEKDDGFRATVFRTQTEWMMWRQFQARIFLRDVR
ncbi:MAG: hypothetical protein ACLQNE_03105 [Thermoguttaceae bacterium]|jgi:hypothetical protein